MEPALGGASAGAEVTHPIRKGPKSGCSAPSEPMKPGFLPPICSARKSTSIRSLKPLETLRFNGVVALKSAKRFTPLQVVAPAVDL